MQTDHDVTHSLGDITASWHPCTIDMCLQDSCSEKKRNFKHIQYCREEVAAPTLIKSLSIVKILVVTNNVEQCLQIAWEMNYFDLFCFSTFLSNLINSAQNHWRTNYCINYTSNAHLKLRDFQQPTNSTMISPGNIHKIVSTSNYVKSTFFLIIQHDTWAKTSLERPQFTRFAVFMICNDYLCTLWHKPARMMYSVRHFNLFKSCSLQCYSLSRLNWENLKLSRISYDGWGIGDVGKLASTISESICCEREEEEDCQEIETSF